MEYPPLLSAKHIMHMLSVSRPKAYEIMDQPHRPVWNPPGGRKPGDTKRLHRDLFLEQLRQESSVTKPA